MAVPPGGPPGGGPRGNGDPEDADDFARQALGLFTGFKNSMDTLGTVLGSFKTDSGDGGKAKVKDPDVFDGNDPAKLKTFLVSLSLVFLDRPNYFTDQRKITYTLSYLSGAAREWFEPDLLDPDLGAMPAWTRTFQALVKELQDNFGVYDAQGDAEEKLGSLRMRENETVRKYNVRFNTLAASTNWDVSALKWAYQRGLANRIKDELVHVPEPRDLAAYRTAVNIIDRRYWQREQEKRRDNPRNPPVKEKFGGKRGNTNSGSSNTSSQPSSTPSTSNQSSNQQGKKPNWSGNKNNSNWKGNSASGQSSGQSSNQSGSKSPPKPHAKHLGSDGKVKPEELERRRKFNLCRFCGGKHNLDDCELRKANSNRPRGRAATTQEELPAIAEVPEN